MTFDGATVRLFVNGSPVASQAMTGAVATSSGPLRLGGNGVWGEFFQGRIDEVRLYARALTQAELQKDMTVPVGLVAAYAFAEGSGTSTADASGNNLTGTLTAAAWTSAGQFGSALTFDGTSSWVTIPATPLLDLPTSLTVEAWVYPTTLTNWRTVVIKETDRGYTYALYAANSLGYPAALMNVGGQDVRISGPSSLPLNTWSHLAMTFDGATVRLFVNGSPVASRATTGAVATSSGPLRLGGNGVWGEFFQGGIDEVRLYDRALTQAELQKDMTTPIGGTAP